MASRRRSLLTTLAELCGLASITYGVAQIYGPAGWITAGLGLILIGALSA